MTWAQKMLEQFRGSGKLTTRRILDTTCILLHNFQLKTWQGCEAEILFLFLRKIALHNMCSAANLNYLTNLRKRKLEPFPAWRKMVARGQNNLSFHAGTQVKRGGNGCQRAE